MTKERRLGRGLEALLGRPAGGEAASTSSFSATAEAHSMGAGLHVHNEVEAPAPAAAATDGLLKLSVYEIDTNPFQPRREFDEAEIDAMAESLEEHGLIQPILVRRQGERYQLIAGERRLRSAIKAGWSEIPAQVREADDRQVAEIAIVENLQRKDLNALEKAASFQKYLEQYRCTHEELAGRLSIDRSTVANLIRLLELPASVQTALKSGAISAGHARALLPLGDDREQTAFCQRIQTEGLSVRSTESLVQEMIREHDEPELAVAGSTATTAGAARTPKKSSKQLASLEQEFRSALGSKVDIRQGAKGRGKIVVHFTSHEEFERLRTYLVGMDVQSQAG